MSPGNRDHPYTPADLAAGRGLREFGAQVRRARAELETPPDVAAIPPSGLRTDVLVEQLIVAEEELTAQFDEIVASRAEIERERLRYVELFELAPDPYLVTDVAGRIEEANLAALELLGLPAGRLQGKPLVAYVVEPERREFRRVLARLGAQAAPATVDVAVRSRRGTVHDISATVAPIRTGDQCHGLRFLMRDVTAQRAIERENERLREQLESAVAERTVELEDALATARQLYEATELASRRKSEFMAFLSHEVRTPMQAVSGYTEILLMELHGTLTAAQRADLERMQRGQRHIVGILDQLLDYARIENGRLDLALERASLDAIVESALELVRPQAEAAGVRLERAGEPLLVRVDVDKARQILVNLLGNAVKFGWPGGVVSVRTARGDGQALLEVDDEGPGVPAPMRGQVFEPFVHLDRSTIGTGLGLPISRRLARAMGGDISLEDKPGAGARFLLRLPLATG